jgi:hypothetical protein
MINMNDQYSVYAYEAGWNSWQKFKDPYDDLTYADPYYKLGYRTAQRFSSYKCKKVVDTA